MMDNQINFFAGAFKTCTPDQKVKEVLKNPSFMQYITPDIDLIERFSNNVLHTQLSFITSFEKDTDAYRILSIYCEKLFKEDEPFNSNSVYMFRGLMDRYRQQVDDVYAFDREVNRYKLTYPQLFGNQI